MGCSRFLPPGKRRLTIDKRGAAAYGLRHFSIGLGQARL
jgi:hypothetical protein